MMDKKMVEELSGQRRFHAGSNGRKTAQNCSGKIGKNYSIFVHKRRY
jgi:hypothetical protein